MLAGIIILFVIAFTYWNMIIIIIFNYALQLLRLIVQSGLDVSTFCHQASPRITKREHPAAEGGTVGEKCPVILPKCRLTRHINGSFTCHKATTWDRWLYFPSKGRCAEDFFALKNPTASAWCKPMNLGTKGQHAISRPSKPLLEDDKEHFNLKKN